MRMVIQTSTLRSRNIERITLLSGLGELGLKLKGREIGNEPILGMEETAVIDEHEKIHSHWF